MPFKSEKQRRLLWAQHPDIARRWAHEYGKQINLPLYANKKKSGKKPKKPATRQHAKKHAATAILHYCLTCQIR